MPSFTIEINWPQEVEERMDLLLVRAKRMRRRLKINLFRKAAIIRSGFRDWMGRLKAEDERPILKSGEINEFMICQLLCSLLGRVRFDDVNLAD